MIPPSGQDLNCDQSIREVLVALRSQADTDLPGEMKDKDRSRTTVSGSYITKAHIYSEHIFEVKECGQAGELAEFLDSGLGMTVLGDMLNSIRLDGGTVL